MTMKRQGRTVMTLCPWHEEKRPSMQVGGKHNTCHCFSCGETHGPIDLVMKVKGCKFTEAMEYLSPTPASPKGEEHHSHVRTKWIQEQKDKEVRKALNLGTMQEMQRFVSLQNALAKCLMYKFPMEVVTRVTWDYMLGVDYDVCHYDHTLFPSIDIEGRVHNVKAQGYVTCPTAERFGHSTKGDTYWVGNKLLPNQDHDTQCLFGEHLLRRYPNRVVVLVESPKNAVVGACQYPELLWLATGNKGMLKRELLEVLKGRRVIVMPDRDAIPEWTEKIRQMQDIATFLMSSFCQSTEDEENGKMDIADGILES